jgi:hypothetical protein
VTVAFYGRASLNKKEHPRVGAKDSLDCMCVSLRLFDRYLPQNRQQKVKTLEGGVFHGCNHAGGVDRSSSDEMGLIVTA